MLRRINRLVAFGAVLTFGLAAVWLLWADRGTILGDRIVWTLIDLWRAGEDVSGLDVVNRNDIPFELDEVGHAVLWAVGTLILGWFGAGLLPLRHIVAGVAGISLAAELGQPLVSNNRGIEASDVVANLIGVGIGAAGLAGIVMTLRLAQANPVRDRGRV
ncbi:MAG: hypothetical protein AAF567_07365 [Actinomycetota bacterium]